MYRTDCETETGYDAAGFLRCIWQIERCGEGALPNHGRLALFYQTLDARGQAWYVQRFGRPGHHDEREGLSAHGDACTLPNLLVVIAEYLAWSRATQPATRARNAATASNAFNAPNPSR